MKAADPSIKRVDEQLVCAAVACRAGEFGGVPTRCAHEIGKTISRPSQVIAWVARLEKPEQAPAAESDSDLPVQPAWIEQNVPGILELAVASMVVSPGKRHGTRSIDAVSSTPLGSTRATITTVDYMLPPARESEGKKRTRRHWNREANQVRSLDLSGAAEAHAARDAEMQRVARAAEREVRDVLDRVIVRVEREIQREARTRARAVALGAAQPWRWCCPAGCKRGSHCAREAFREWCKQWDVGRHAIQAQRRKQWDGENLTRVFVSVFQLLAAPTLALASTAVAAAAFVLAVSTTAFASPPSPQQL